jgi:deoxyribonuclease V
MSLIPHNWDVSIDEAKRIQRGLAKQVILKDDFKKIEKIAGIGVVFSKAQDEVFVGCVILSFPELEILEQSTTKMKISFPYLPGFFAFSASPAILSALEKIEKPDLIMFPGRGIAHPRGLGLASHSGVLLEIPTIACSKTPLWKDHSEPLQDKGEYVLVKGERERLMGAVVRTREGKKPVFVTPGHKISIETAVRIVLECCPKYKIPQPLRSAHILAKKIAKIEAG